MSEANLATGDVIGINKQLKKIEKGGGGGKVILNLAKHCEKPEYKITEAEKEILNNLKNIFGEMTTDYAIRNYVEKLK